MLLREIGQDGPWACVLTETSARSRRINVRHKIQVSGVSVSRRATQESKCRHWARRVSKLIDSAISSPNSTFWYPGNTSGAASRGLSPNRCLRAVGSRTTSDHIHLPELTDRVVVEPRVKIPPIADATKGQFRRGGALESVVDVLFPLYHDDVVGGELIE